jgi:Flp pilus assembly protein TadG
MTGMEVTRLWRACRSTVALMFALTAVPITGLVGLAVDYGFWNQSYASISLAASSAALNAVKIASAANLKNDANARSEGQSAGQQWFMAQVQQANGTANAAQIAAGQVQVDVSVAATTIASVSYSGYVTSIFGGMLGMVRYPIRVTAKAEIIANPYLDVEILLDNSPSMEIGATPGDIAAMMYLTPCSPSAVTPTPAGLTYADQGWGTTTYTGTGYHGANDPYDEEAYPLRYIANASAPSAPPFVGGTAPTCPNIASLYPGKTYTAGAPCGFACHFDTAHAGKLSASYDYYGLARSTIGQVNNCYALTNLNGSQPPTPAQLSSCAITLRFDLVKNAVNQTITAMQADNITTLNNLHVGVYWFATSVNQVYPAPSGPCAPLNLAPVNTQACQAGNDWAAAMSAVGAPPTAPNTLDTGIQPYQGANGGDTDMHATLTSLATQYLTAAGDGSSAESPLKVLFLVTDGLNDPANRNQTGVSAADCQLFKSMGYAVYVVFTPYYPLMNNYYVSSDSALVEGTGATSLAGSLQACASDPVHDYIEASPTDQTSINTALQTFLKRAIASAARFTE